jgi:16S rRNA (uracil1498-N3)-methyltransferase
MERDVRIPIGKLSSTRIGAIVTVSDEVGRDHRGRVIASEGGTALVRLFEPLILPSESDLDIVLIQAIPKKEKMSLIVQKATELGVSEIWPVAAERCVVRLDEDRAGRRAGRWRRIAEEATKQSQRAVVPVVREPITVPGLAEEAGRFDVVLVPWEEAPPDGLGIGAALDAAGATPGSSVLLVIGPEGGFTEAEVAVLEAAGGVAVTLGDTVLRTETAAVVALALVEYELGALGGRAR